jgi:hypothetical protein
MKTIRLITALFIAGSLFACTNDDDDSVTPETQVTPNEEELITTVKLSIKDTANLSVNSFSFRDLDGPGGNSPSIDTIKLSAGMVYDVEIQFQDESDPANAEDITTEIRAEDDEHLICFESMNVSGLSMVRTDSDGTYEVGLTSQWSFGNNATASGGMITITLRHQPGSKDGSCSPGDIDVEVNFPLILQ